MADLEVPGGRAPEDPQEVSKEKRSVLRKAVDRFRAKSKERQEGRKNWRAESEVMRELDYRETINEESISPGDAWKQELGDLERMVAARGEGVKMEIKDKGYKLYGKEITLTKGLHVEVINVDVFPLMEPHQYSAKYNVRVTWGGNSGVFYGRPVDAVFDVLESAFQDSDDSYYADRSEK